MSNKKFLQISSEQIEPEKILEYGLYIFLRLNDRMIRVRSKGQFIESGIYQNYVTKGHVSFFVLKEEFTGDSRGKTEVSAAVDDDSLSSEVDINDDGPEDIDDVAIKELDDFDLSAEERTKKEEIEIDFGEKVKSRSEREAEESILANELTNSELEEFEATVDEGEEDENINEDELIEFKDFDLEEDITIDANEIDEDVEMNFQKEKSELEKALLRADKDSEFIQVVKGDFESNDNDKITVKDNSESEEEEEHNIKSEKEILDDEIVSLGSDIENLEEDLNVISHLSDEELEEIRFKQDRDEEMLVLQRLPDDAPQLRGLSNDEKSMVKLSFAMSKSLDNLRDQFSKLNKMDPDDENPRELIEERKKEVESSITRIENTLLEVEFLDEKAAKDDERATRRANQDSLSESEIEEERLEDEKIAKTISSVRENLEFIKDKIPIDKSDFDRARASLEKHTVRGSVIRESAINEVQDKLKFMSENTASQTEIDEANAELQKEFIKAKVSINMSNAIMKKQRMLMTLLAKTPANDEEQAKQEKAALKIQSDIFELRELQEKHNSDDNDDLKIIKPFLPSADEIIVVKAHEDPTEAFKKAFAELNKLKEEAQEARIKSVETNTKMDKTLKGDAAASGGEIQVLHGNKHVQIAAYAVLFVSILGYEDLNYYDEIALASLLAEHPGMAFEDGIPIEVREIFKESTSRFTHPDMAIREGAQLIKLAKEYSEEDDVVTGDFNLKNDILDRVYTRMDKDFFDLTMLERIRQTVARSSTRELRMSASQIALEASNRLNSARNQIEAS